jgi:phosphatidylglycerophosphate synthase
MDQDKLLFVAVSDSPARPFGMSVKERAARIARNLGLDPVDAPVEGRAAIIANLRYAWDPAWLKAIKARPGSVLTLDGEPVLAHVRADKKGAAAIAAMEKGAALKGYEVIDAENAELNYAELRKRERPFVLAIDPDDPAPVERASYDAAYKGVTDVLTLYLWRKPAFYLTRWAARARLSPNLITAIGAAFCIAAFYYFWVGQYWLGVGTGFVFMVLDTVDGKLARCTGASSKWGNIFDHGIDLIHPPFWWWAWAHGLAAYGTTLRPIETSMVLWAIVGGYVLQRLIEGIFMRRFGGMHIHVWESIDSRFRLITARRNPNMMILVASLPFMRPDWGLILVAFWTVISCIFHAIRLAQASERAARGIAIRSWLEG